MREVVEIIRAAFEAQKGGGLSYEGDAYKLSIPQFVRPHAPRVDIPICIAGVNRGMIRAAAAVADGLIGHPVYTRKYIAEKVQPELEGSRCELMPYVVCSVSNDREQARNEARAQIAFYYTTRIYHSILDVHGWREIGETISGAFRKGDFKAMAAAVPDELVDWIAVSGTPDEVRDQLKQWDGLTEQVLLYPPSIGVSPERVDENLQAIVETFGN